MRFGCCASMVAVEPDGTGVEVVEKLKEIGYDYIELSLTHITALPEDTFDALKKRLEASGIRCETCNNFFPPSLKLTGPEVDADKVMAYVDKALNRASQLGVEFVVFGSGGAKNVPEGFPMEQAWQQLVTLSRNIDPNAKRYGITIVIEPLRSQECNIINTVAEGLALAKEVDRDSIKLLADYYHVASENEDPDIILKAADFLKHVHIAQLNGRVYPKEITEDNYKPFIENLKKINYQGRVSVEGFTKNFHTDAEDTLKFFKKYF